MELTVFKLTAQWADGLTDGDSVEVMALETVEILSLLKVKFLSLWLDNKVLVITMTELVEEEQVHTSEEAVVVVVLLKDHSQLLQYRMQLPLVQVEQLLQTEKTLLLSVGQ
jgi:hypothetical protein